MSEQLVCVDWADSYEGVTLIWPDARTCTVNYLFDGDARVWQVSGKQIRFLAPDKVAINWGGQWFEVTASPSQDHCMISTSYLLSSAACDSFAALPTAIWRVLEGRTKACADREASLPGDPSAMFAAAKALSALILKDSPENPSNRLVCFRPDQLQGYMRDDINEVVAAVIAARTPSALTQAVLERLAIIPALPQVA